MTFSLLNRKSIACQILWHPESVGWPLTPTELHTTNEQNLLSLSHSPKMKWNRLSLLKKPLFLTKVLNIKTLPTYSRSSLHIYKQCSSAIIHVESISIDIITLIITHCFAGSNNIICPIQLIVEDHLTILTRVIMQIKNYVSYEHYGHTTREHWVDNKQRSN